MNTKQLIESTLSTESATPGGKDERKPEKRLGMEAAIEAVANGDDPAEVVEGLLGEAKNYDIAIGEAWTPELKKVIQQGKNIKSANKKLVQDMGKFKLNDAQKKHVKEWMASSFSALGDLLGRKNVGDKSWHDDLIAANANAEPRGRMPDDAGGRLSTKIGFGILQLMKAATKDWIEKKGDKK